MKCVWPWVVLLIVGCASPLRQSTMACADCQGSVVVFLGVDCPISQKYVGRLNALHQRTGGQFRWTVFIPQKITKSALDNFRSEYAISFPMRLDDRKRAAAKFSASVTPEVFVFDKHGDIRYRGAIDNWFYELGKYRPRPTEHYLDSALAAVMQNKKLAVTKTDPVGCFIQFKK